MCLNIIQYEFYIHFVQHFFINKSINFEVCKKKHINVTQTHTPPTLAHSYLSPTQTHSSLRLISAPRLSLLPTEPPPAAPTRRRQPPPATGRDLDRAPQHLDPARKRCRGRQIAIGPHIATGLHDYEDVRQRGPRPQNGLLLLVRWGITLLDIMSLIQFVLKFLVCRWTMGFPQSNLLWTFARNQPVSAVFRMVPVSLWIMPSCIVQKRQENTVNHCGV
jgi:hypothetical protein